MSEIELQRASIAHLKSLRQIWNESFVHLGMSIDDFENLFFDLAISTRVALVEGRAVGALLFRKCKEWTEILALFVTPECRGRGVASCLLTSVLQEFRKDHLPLVRLHTSVDNVAAQALFSKFGFMVADVGSRYPSGTPAIMYRKALIEKDC